MPSGYSPPPSQPKNATQTYFSCFQCLTRKRAAPPGPTHSRRFPYSVLRRATSSFSARNRLGQGGFGSVFRGVLPPGRQQVAVKLLDPGSLQGEREFENELLFAGKTQASDRIISLIGFSKKKRGGRLVLVYELMCNGSLQDALVNRKCEELVVDWKKRFGVAIDVAKGLEFLHDGCVPPVVHGDVKPSNVLLDCGFNAKIADFGLARVRNGEAKEGQIGRDCNELDRKNGDQEIRGCCEYDRFLNEETASVTTSTATSSLEYSPENFMKVLDSELSPETVAVEEIDHSKLSERNLDQITPHSGKDVDGEHGRLKGSEPERVNEYVWVLSEINESGKSDQVATPKDDSKLSGKIERERRLEWWMALEEEEEQKKNKNHPPRKWWRDEFYEELAMKKNNKKQGFELISGSRGNEDRCENRKLEDKNIMKKKHRRGSWGSIDWWLDGFSGELLSGRGNSKKWASCETPKSSLSMRGTVCYTAPECSGGGGEFSEKCDVYSFGVLLLVLVSGRRPLQVTVSPKLEHERASLIAWARHLACKGKLLDLVDSDIKSLNQEQAVLCIKVALLCLQRSAAKRPAIKEVLQMLSGKCDLPHLPF